MVFFRFLLKLAWNLSILTPAEPENIITDLGKWKKWLKKAGVSGAHRSSPIGPRKRTPPLTPSMHASPLHQPGSEVLLLLTKPVTLGREHEVSREKAEVEDG